MESKPKKINLFTRLIKGGHIPDILDCIANLSSDEVFTPPDLVDKILDLLPEEVWHDKNLKWLDPACKTGIFLRQIAFRLMNGLKNEFPDEEERRQHIFKNMLYGIALTDLTALMSRRSLYTSKFANGEKSIADFQDENGNIRYDNRPHTYQNGSCIYCGNKEGSDLDRDESRERHAYNFIHLKEEELQNMKFDIIVGNPPYQLSDGGGTGSSAMPIYQYFVQQARRLEPKYMSFIIPSRWFAGGKGLDGFREEIIHDHRIRKIYDYPDANDCFPGVEIKGGVMYFIWDKNYDGDCEITTIIANEESMSIKRPLDEYDIFVRWNNAIPILRKVKSRNESTLDEMVSSRRPFDFNSNFKDFDQINNPDKVKIYAMNGKTGFIPRTRVQSNKSMIDTNKVLMAKAGSINGKYPNNVIGSIIVAEPGSICTETFLVVGQFKTNSEAENYAKYLKTRFVRFLLLLRTPTQNMSKSCFAFVPNLPMDREWTDEKLYTRYNITPEEQEFIESLVKELK
ncbi:Eco57I restriction-modification methylase domain-containing protein [Candidatus Saccharibacteria bacterium]|nr:Eco57I restriction-modification methylase domain-containing protein [Candidatus Saccharibacteria bacterium]